MNRDRIKGNLNRVIDMTMADWGDLSVEDAGQAIARRDSHARAMPKSRMGAPVFESITQKRSTQQSPDAADASWS